MALMKSVFCSMTADALRRTMTSLYVHRELIYYIIRENDFTGNFCIRQVMLHTVRNQRPADS